MIDVFDTLIKLEARESKVQLQRTDNGKVFNADYIFFIEDTPDGDVFEAIKESDTVINSVMFSTSMVTKIEPDVPRIHLDGCTNQF